MSLRRSNWTPSAHAAAPVTAYIGKDKAGRGQHDEQHQPGPQGGAVDEDDVVDDLPFDERNDRLAHASQNRGPHGDNHVTAVPEHVPAQPPHPPRPAPGPDFALGFRVSGAGRDRLPLAQSARPSASRSVAICSMASPIHPSVRKTWPGSGVLAQTSSSHATIAASSLASTLYPSSVNCRAAARWSPLTPERTRRPRLHRDSTLALTVGLPRANLAAIREARWSPEAIAARTR